MQSSARAISRPSEPCAPGAPGLRIDSAEPRMRSDSPFRARGPSLLAARPVVLRSPLIAGGADGRIARDRAASRRRSVRSASRSCSAARRRRVSSAPAPGDSRSVSLATRRSASASWRASNCKSPIARRRSSGRARSICRDKSRSCSHRLAAALARLIRILAAEIAGRVLHLSAISFKRRRWTTAPAIRSAATRFRRTTTTAAAFGALLLLLLVGRLLLRRLLHLLRQVVGLFGELLLPRAGARADA